MAGAQPASAPAGAEHKPMRLARIAAILALIVAFVLVGTALFGGGSGHQYKLLFETGGQLVTGNQVLVGGQPIGEINGLSLTDNGQAEVEITVDEPLHEGTTAVVRATSLSGIANRYISISPGPNNAPSLPDGATLTTDETTAPVDLDELFNTLDHRTRAALQNVIQGSATIYEGAGPQANKTYKYFYPALSSTRRLFEEITRDQRALQDFLVDSSRVVTAVAERRDDLSALTQNTNEALGAIARRNVELDRALAALPPFMRQADTTFVNLRAALDDIDPLVRVAKPATKNLAGFLRNLRPVARRGVPVFGDLALAVNRDGKHNDLTDSLFELPKVQRKAKKASAKAVDAMDATQDNVAFARPYTPDLLAWLAHFGEVTGYYDANGHYARVSPAASNVFSYDTGTGALEPIPPSDQFLDIDFGIMTRCPGGSTQPAADGSTPFLDGGNLTGQCDPADVAPGSFP
jgi:phospholipid/cholesterol/gamma-HCH transport system substrate-binding protein